MIKVFGQVTRDFPQPYITIPLSSKAVGIPAIRREPSQLRRKVEAEWGLLPEGAIDSRLACAPVGTLEFHGERRAFPSA